MCLMAPGRVVSLDGDTCGVETGGQLDRVSRFLTPEVEVGDWVLVMSGTIVRRLHPDQAEEMSRAFDIVFGQAAVS